MSLLPETLAFGETPLTLIDRQGEPWLTAEDLGRALGYSPVVKGGTKLGYPSEHSTIGSVSHHIKKIFDRHADEFTDQMTALVDMETPGGRQKVRIFSPRGCHLIAMFSRTERAKAFRRWVLDVLERHIRGSGPECRLMPLLALTHGRWGRTLRPGGYNAISLNTAQVFAYLLEQYGDGAWHEVSQRQLSAEAGIPRSSLAKALDGLEAWGLLRRREGGPGESGRIRLLMGRIRREMKRVEFPLPVKPAGLLH
ncbi:MAG: BRO family protein [Gammaproteobacteria bacterium]|nr:BRO family protein [Gammaproteobacteria bacterium]